MGRGCFFQTNIAHNMIILGLDLGAASLGWALSNDSRPDNRLVDCGVIIFKEGVNIDAKSGKEESRTVRRRMMRQARRQIQRRTQRRRQLLQYLRHIGLVPPHHTAHHFDSRRDVYVLRAAALRRALLPAELAQVLYHFAKRRGFKSSRKSGSTSDSSDLFKGDPKVGLLGFNDTETAMKEGNFATFGEYLASLNPHQQRRRNRYTLRKWYEHEVESILQVQKAHHPTLQDEEVTRRIKEILFFQRPLRSQKQLLGKCELEPRRPRTPKASLHFEVFRAWQTINNLKLWGKNVYGEELTLEQKQQLWKDLFSQRDEITPEQILKNLKGKDAPLWSINSDEKKFKGCGVAAKLRKIFGAAWDSFDAKKQEQIWHVLYENDSEESIIQYAQKKWGVNEAQAAELAQIKMPQGYVNLSRHAIERVLPELQKGLRYHTACEAAGYRHARAQRAPADAPEYTLRQLPPVPNLRNPIVQKALGELRRLINALIQRYGTIDLIRIEMLRELRISKEQREEKRKDQKQREARNEADRERLKRDFGIQTEGRGSTLREDIIKMRLYDECKGVCPYSGDKIEPYQLFNGEFEIEHILPYSRTLDDSSTNKTLCRKDINIAKGDKTPREFFSSTDFDEAMERLRSIDFPKNKINKFATKEFNEDFIQRQVNDSQYLAAAAADYVRKLGDVEVQTVMGGATAELRHLWGLNSVLHPLGFDSKNREDHRHHALDAIVVANTTVKMLQTLSRRHSGEYNGANNNIKFRLSPPYANFREQAEFALSNVLVVHRHQAQKTAGQLHEETFYGEIKDHQGKRRGFAVRKKLQDLTAAMVEKIIDPIVQEAVVERIKAFGGNIGDKELWKQPLYMPNPKGGKPTVIKKVRILQQSSNAVRLQEHINKWVEPGSNHHIAIYRLPNGKIKGPIVSFFEANRRQRLGEPLIDKRGEIAGSEFLFSLSKDEMVLLYCSPELLAQQSEEQYSALSAHLYRVVKLTEGSICLALHNASNVKADKDPAPKVLKVPPTKLIDELKALKVTLNAEGRIAAAE